MPANGCWRPSLPGAIEQRSVTHEAHRQPSSSSAPLQAGAALFLRWGPDVSGWFFGPDEWPKINIHSFHLLRPSCLVSPKSSRAASNKGAAVGQKFTTPREWLSARGLVRPDSRHHGAFLLIQAFLEDDAMLPGNRGMRVLGNGNI